MISEAQRDALCELVNIGIGRAASTLNALIEHKIRLSVPTILIIESEEELEQLPESLNIDRVASISMAFRGDLAGNAALMFPAGSANTLVSALTGEAPDSPALEELRAGTLAEIGNILLNGVMGSLSNMLGTSLTFTVPSFDESSLREIVRQRVSEAVLVAQAQFVVDELLVEGNILLFFEVASFRALLASVDEMLAA